MAQNGATKKASIIGDWFDGLIADYSDHILPIDAAIAKASGQLEAMARAAEHALGDADALLAGSAKVHDLTVINHNPRHFLPAEISIMSPDEFS